MGDLELPPKINTDENAVSKMNQPESISSQKENQPESISSQKEIVSLFGLFAAADTNDYILMFIGSVGSCMHGAALLVFFILFGRMIDLLGHMSSDPHRSSLEVSKHALYLVYLGLVVLVSAWIGVACWTQTGERQTACLRFKYLRSVLRKDITFFDTEARDTNLTFHISSDAILVQDAIGDKIGHSIRYLSQFILGFILGFMSVWKLTLVTLAVVPLIAVAGGGYTVIMSTLSEKSEAAYAEAGKIAEEFISQVRTVYSFVGEDQAVEAYSESLKNALKLGKKSGMAKGIGVGFTYGLLFCSWALLLWYASVLVRHGETNGGNAFTTIINVIFSGFALGQAAPNLAAIAKGRASATNIITMIEEDLNPSSRLEKGMVLPKVDGQIEFSEVCFTYPSRAGMVFENLSFSLTAGKTFAFVSPSGSGKSTVISMIQRFYDPCSGKILLDRHDLKNMQLKWLREQMGLVSQEPTLFATTIALNILYGKEGADMDHIIDAAKAANAHSFIQGLPEGYQTQVGEGGTQLSGGQKQRIAIARAMLRNPKILLLDEATSALDAESEFIVQQALQKVMSGRTAIIVAHRLSTIRSVDRILVLKNGQIIEQGNHLEIVSKGGEYAALVRLQVSENIKDSVTTGAVETSAVSSFKDLTYNHSNERETSLMESKEIQPAKHKLTSLSSAPTSSVWELVKLNAPEWPDALLGSVGAILAGMSAPLFAFGITYILTTFYSHDNHHIKQEIKWVSLIFVGGAILCIPVYWLQHYFYTLMGERLTMRVRQMMFTAILSNEVGWFDSHENSTGSLTSKLAANATLVRSSLADRLSTIVQNMALMVTAFVIAFTLSWRISSVVIATFPLLVGASIAEQLFLKGFGGDYNRSYSRATSVACEAIANIRTVAAFGAEDQMALQYASELKEPSKQALLRGHISGFGYGVTQLFAFCSYALGLWYASVLMKDKNSNFGDLIKCFMILIITALSVAETLALAPDIVKGSEALASDFEILHRKSTINSNSPDSVLMTSIRGDIEFKNVIFKYPARPDITIFDGLNFEVYSGKSLAIVGKSGSGKSTVIQLLMRFYDPSSGTISIDGVDIKNFNLKSLRLKIGLVQQEPSLFSTTIYDNIKYGNKNASEIEIMKAAKAANAHSFISRMPEGYQTQVGEKGVQLSGGQKQRVAIARAILKNPTILLLDEATSALDTTSESQVQEALDKLMVGRTTILVAHRLSTIRDANSIALLQNGKVVEIGTHEQLICSPESLYTQLVNLQQG